MPKLFVWLTSILLLTLLVGCSSLADEEEVEPVSLTIKITTSSNINPSQLSEGNPVVVSFYQLSNVDVFDSAQTLDLYQQDTSLLANTLVQKKTLPSLLPNEKKTINLTIMPGTKYLAAFTQFSDYSQAKTKAWLDISQIDEIKNLELSIDALTVNMFLVPKESFWSW